MIYFDNSATGARKPASVLRAVRAQLRAPANPGRSGHRLSIDALALCEETRERAGKLCGVSPERILFSKNCTESLNLAIFGLIPDNSHVVLSQFDHNATLRPVHALCRRNHTYSVAFPENGRVTAKSVEKALKKDTQTVVLNCVSNVLGCPAEVEEISALCKRKGLLLILDGAQYVGHHETELSSLYYTALAAAPHKTLFAPQGIAFLAARELPKPLLCGGTGTASAELEQPGDAPEGFESGTLNMPGIAGLNAGLRYYEARRKELSERLSELCRYLYESLVKLDGIRVYSSPNAAGIVSILKEGKDSSELSDFLSRRGIATRSGLHCAPLVHRFLGTERSGLCRISLSPANTSREIDRLTAALREF